MKSGESMKEKAPEYWEETSYFRILPKSGIIDYPNELFSRIESIDDLEIIEAVPFEPDGSGRPGKLVVSYKDETFEAGYYIDEFHFSDSYNLRTYFFSESELSAIRVADSALVLFMNFGRDSKLSYHLQLKLAIALVPDMLAIVDESAEKVVNARWVRLAAQSTVLPGPSSLFTVQAISNEKNEVWLHTHGLTRCGLYELEILGSDVEHYNDHYHVLSSLASRMLDKADDAPDQAEGVHLGLFFDNSPIVTTFVSWDKGLWEYPRNILGGIADRKEGHNTHSALIFFYDDDEDEANGFFRKINDYDNKLTDNPLFFISDSETQRMSDLARERFGLVRYMGQKETPIIIKAGLKTDSSQQSDEREHIWLELLEIDGDKIKGKLVQNPYDISALHEGDEVWFSVNDVTDWRIYLENYSVEPDTAYLLV
ncbi:MAG: DUF4026 domain-containing protein [Bacteroides sp.]|nr:DUF4026 domain-containing protein [Bacteroides sp.]